MTQITHKLIDGRMVQIVTPQELRRILDQDGSTYDPPADFTSDDEWNVAE